MSQPTPVTPIDAGPGGVVDHLVVDRVPVDDQLAARLADACDAVSTLDADRAEAGRDWWPLAIGWAAAGAVPSRPALVARPTDVAQVSAVLALCHEARVPVTPAGGRSGVCGASIPLFGGVALDLCGLAGIGGCRYVRACGQGPGVVRAGRQVERQPGGKDQGQHQQGKADHRGLTGSR